MKNRKAAMELTMGTMVTIVLLVMALILGIFLVQKIFTGAVDVVGLTQQQLESEVNRLFAEEQKMVIYPSTRFVEIEQGEIGGVGIGIKNLLEGVTGTQTFSYEVVVSDASNCVETPEQIETWITTGKAEQNIPVPVGELSAQKVLIQPPVGSSLCTARFRVNVKAGETAYATDFFDVKIEA